MGRECYTLWDEAFWEDHREHLGLISNLGAEVPESMEEFTSHYQLLAYPSQIKNLTIITTCTQHFSFIKPSSYLWLHFDTQNSKIII